MTPNLDAAAIKATETLIKRRITAPPVFPLPILKATPGVLVLPFTEMAARIGSDRASVINAFGAENRDAVTSVCSVAGKLRYFVAYNQRLPLYVLQRALAREMGHIALGHDGSRPEDVRQAEALCFARHLLCPRPLIRAIQNAGIPITAETFGNITGCYGKCLADLQATPGARVPPQFNRMLREQLADYISNFVDCRSIIMRGDNSATVDFGTYMDDYEE